MNISTRKQKITKAVIAAAGYGTRFLPATKSQPKEMLPIVDKPIIHYLVEEVVNSGIKDIIIVVRSGQVSLEDYFDSNPALEAELESKGKKDLLEEVQKIHKMANFIFVRQSSDLPYGSATPLLSATPIIEKGEPFVYMFGDDLTISENPITKQIIDAYEKEKADVALGVQEVSWDDVHKYGTVRYKKGSDSEIEDAIEEAKREIEGVDVESEIAEAGITYELTLDIWTDGDYVRKIEFCLDYDMDETYSTLLTLFDLSFSIDDLNKNLEITAPDNYIEIYELLAEYGFEEGLEF
jgi:UTP--glucose-1-phosphate uridylyltransferase